MTPRAQESSGFARGRGRGGGGGWTITRKLFVLIVTVVVGFLVLAAIQFRTVEQVRIDGPAYHRLIDMKDLVADILPPPEYIIEAYLLVQQLVEEKEPRQRDEWIAKLGKLQSDYNERHQVWVEKLSGPPDKPLRDALLVASYQPAVEFFRVVQTQFVPAVQAGDKRQAHNMAHGVLRRYYDQHRKAIDQTVELATARYDAEKETADQLLFEGRMTGIPVATTLLLLVVIYGLVLSNQIRRSLQETASTLSTFSAQLAATIEEQERATAVQAAAVNETTATMEELSSSFQQASSVAQSASEHARHALALASGGNGRGPADGLGSAGLQEKIRAVTQDLLRLGEQTSQIDAITRSVSDIAGQTNMLALNAAVEAARAGENGRGFAVVALEVRKLADESRKSAERSLELLGEIEKATTATVLSMEQGTKSVDEVARALEHLQQASQQAALNIQQQLGAVHQVTSAMGDLSNSAHETAAGVAQTRSGIRTLQERAEALSGMV